MMGKQTDYNARLYAFYKSLGICVKCGQDDAMINAVLCPTCAEKRAQHDKRRRERNLEAYRAQKAAAERIRRAKRKAAGVCMVCGRYPADTGMVICQYCRAKRKAKYLEKRTETHIMRELRIEFGLCYTCGEPIKEGFKLCEKHWIMAAAQMRRLLENPTPAMIAHRQKIRRITAISFRKGKCHE
jgi:NMD protein affecting ribosome stability and mRNA decay